MSDLIEKLSDLRSQFNCFDENKYEAYRTLSEAIKVISERPEPCEDDKGCSNCMYSGRPTYKSPCAECRDNSQWEMKPISRGHENGAECKDAVSREAVLNINTQYHGKMPNELNHQIWKDIKALPSVTPKRKTGKWIEEQRSIKVTLYKCSECGRAVIDDTGYDAAKDFPFCHCGADMRSEAEQEVK